MIMCTNESSSWAFIKITLNKYKYANKYLQRSNNRYRGSTIERMEKDLGRPFTRISMPISLKSGITCVCVCVCVDDVETGKASFSAYQLLEFEGMYIKEKL